MMARSEAALGNILFQLPIPWGTISDFLLKICSPPLSVSHPGVSFPSTIISHPKFQVIAFVVFFFKTFF